MLLLTFLIAVVVVAALSYLVLWLKRMARVRRGRQELERREDCKRTIERLQEAFSCKVLVNLTTDQAANSVNAIRAS
jgi:hypothetical protein